MGTYGWSKMVRGSGNCQIQYLETEIDASNKIDALKLVDP